MQNRLWSIQNMHSSPVCSDLTGPQTPLTTSSFPHYFAQNYFQIQTSASSVTVIILILYASQYYCYSVSALLSSLHADQGEKQEIYALVK